MTRHVCTGGPDPGAASPPAHADRLGSTTRWLPAGRAIAARGHLRPSLGRLLAVAIAPLIVSRVAHWASLTIARAQLRHMRSS